MSLSISRSLSLLGPAGHRGLEWQERFVSSSSVWCFLPRHPCRCSAIVRSTEGSGWPLTSTARALTVVALETKKAVRTDPEWKGQHLTGRCRQPLTGPESDLTALLCWLSTSNGSDYTHPKTACKCMADGVGLEPTHRFPDDGLASRCLNLSANHPWHSVTESNRRLWIWNPRPCHWTNAAHLAEEVRFELTAPFDTTVFKTAALNRSATLPKLVPDERIELPTFRLQGDCTTAVLIRLAA